MNQKGWVRMCAIMKKAQANVFLKHSSLPYLIFPFPQFQYPWSTVLQKY
jgi:hypothetical protein